MSGEEEEIPVEKRPAFGTVLLVLLLPLMRIFNTGLSTLAHSGAIGYSHVNDSGFWLVGRFLGVDTKTMLKTWTVISLMAFGLAWLVFTLL